MRVDGDVSLPYVPGSEQSREAAEKMRPRANEWRKRVWEFIRDNGPCSDKQILQGMRELFGKRTKGNTVRPRRVELERAKLIKRHTRNERPKSGAPPHPRLYFEITGDPYPERWTHEYESFNKLRRKRAPRRPKAEHLRIAAQEMIDAEELVEFSAETHTVIIWLMRLAELEPPPDKPQQIRRVRKVEKRYIRRVRKVIR